MIRFASIVFRVGLTTLFFLRSCIVLDEHSTFLFAPPQIFILQVLRAFGIPQEINLLVSLSYNKALDHKIIKRKNSK